MPALLEALPVDDDLVDRIEEDTDTDTGQGSVIKKDARHCQLSRVRSTV